jgi:hypothetical protein
MNSPSEAPGYFGEPVSFLPSLPKVIVSVDVFIHLLRRILPTTSPLPVPVAREREREREREEGKDMILNKVAHLF